MNRKQRRAMKKEFGEEAVNKMEAVEKAISNMSSSCSNCNEVFDKNDKTIIDNWHVNITDKGMILTCDKCFKNDL